MTNSLAIKNLAIALEALSRINGEKVVDTFKYVHDLLLNEITNAHKESNPAHIGTSQLTDDDIPF